VADATFLSWPFFGDCHRALAEALELWCAENLPVDHVDGDAVCRTLVPAPAMIGAPGEGALPKTESGKVQRFRLRPNA
jgi:acyl-CoA dehydrogenase